MYVTLSSKLIAGLYHGYFLSVVCVSEVF